MDSPEHMTDERACRVCALLVPLFKLLYNRAAYSHYLGKLLDSTKHQKSVILIIISFK